MRSSSHGRSGRAPGPDRRAPGQRQSPAPDPKAAREAKLGKFLPHRRQPAESSPRLLPLGFESGLSTGAPLQEPHPTEPVERFCTHGPVSDLQGDATKAERRPQTFADVVAHLDGAVGQAVLLLNDRLKTLQLRVARAGGPEQLTEAQSLEICAIAEGVAAASYHLQKWTHKFSPETKPASKPVDIDSAELAISIMHLCSPRIMMANAEAHKHLLAAVKSYGDGAASRVEKLGIPEQDLRAIGPHLEMYVGRLGRLAMSSMGEGLKKFVLEYFRPAIGSQPSQRLVAFLGLSAATRIK